MAPALTPYDHADHVGNRCDVWKHTALLSTVEAITSEWESERTFRYLDTHSGLGFFELGDDGEWRDGIGRSGGRAPRIEHPYLDLCRRPLDRRQYLGSWRLVREFLLQKGQAFALDLYDTSTVVSHAIWSQIERRELQNVRFHQLDGYEAVPEARDHDLVLIDPPYKPFRNDWPRCRKALAQLADNKATYLLWYPIVWPSHPQRLVDTAHEVGFEVLWAEMGETPSRRLKGCGVVAGGQAREALEAARPVLKTVAEFLDGTLHRRGPGRKATSS